MKNFPLHLLILLPFFLASALLHASEPSPFARYFAAETAALAQRAESLLDSHTDWTANRERYRQQLLDMLGLHPLPERTPLHPAITGRLEHEDFTVEKLQFQSLPGLYITANLYLPTQRAAPAPAILYLCGHARAVRDGISFGNKTGYQHHGAWLAQNGYVCLVLDTIQLGEIEGIHHGTYNHRMWWWNARGYTPAGVEAWNALRALDYLETRPEVDPTRFGVTGRSGGGAYSWWITAIDERIKVAAPVAGITDLHNHVVDGVVEGHCDCMFHVNTHGWDFALIAALAAPRPLLICNTDKDPIFPLDGVARLHALVARVYQGYNRANALGLLITAGGHNDSQDLQLPVLRWFNRHLKETSPLITNAAIPHFPPESLKVFPSLPRDERTSRIHDTFVPIAPEPLPPQSSSDWTQQKQRWMAFLQESVFASWNRSPYQPRWQRRLAPPGLDHPWELWNLDVHQELQLPIVVRRAKETPSKTILIPASPDQWQALLSNLEAEAPTLWDALRPTNYRSRSPSIDAKPEPLDPTATYLWVAPRGVGPTAWPENERVETHLKRRFMLLGQTLGSMRVWDIRCAMEAARAISSPTFPLEIHAREEMAAHALYATLFTPYPAKLLLADPPTSHRIGPDYLNVLRQLDIPAAAAMAAEISPVTIQTSQPEAWAFPRQVAQALNWPPGQFVVQPLP
jgi:dienelactone hydrolase